MRYHYYLYAMPQLLDVLLHSCACRKLHIHRISSCIYTLDNVKIDACISQLFINLHKAEIKILNSYR